MSDLSTVGLLALVGTAVLLVPCVAVWVALGLQRRLSERAVDRWDADCRQRHSRSYVTHLDHLERGAVVNGCPWCPEWRA